MVSHQFSALLRDSEIPIPNVEEHFIIFKSVALSRRSVDFPGFLELLEKVAIFTKHSNADIIWHVLEKASSSRTLRLRALSAFLQNATVKRYLDAFRKAFRSLFYFYADASDNDSQQIVDEQAHGKHVAHVTPQGALHFFTSMHLSALALTKVDVLESYLICATVYKREDRGKYAIIYLDDFPQFLCLVALVAASRSGSCIAPKTDDEIFADLLRHLSSQLRPRDVQRIMVKRPKATSGTRMLLISATK